MLTWTNCVYHSIFLLHIFGEFQWCCKSFFTFLEKWYLFTRVWYNIYTHASWCQKFNRRKFLFYTKMGQTRRFDFQTSIRNNDYIFQKTFNYYYLKNSNFSSTKIKSQPPLPTRLSPPQSIIYHTPHSLMIHSYLQSWHLHSRE